MVGSVVWDCLRLRRQWLHPRGARNATAHHPRALVAPSTATGELLYLQRPTAATPAPPSTRLTFSSHVFLTPIWSTLQLTHIFFSCENKLYFHRPRQVSSSIWMLRSQLFLSCNTGAMPSRSCLALFSQSWTHGVGVTEKGNPYASHLNIPRSAALATCHPIHTGPATSPPSLIHAGRCPPRSSC